MARVRSPNFPIISLPQAVERITRIYDQEQTVSADRETIAQHLGYGGLNGASLKMISALRKYDLLEEAGEGLRVSPLAMAILHPSNDQEKQDALREAANGPVLFRRLNEQFEGQRPSETNLRSWLLRNGFSKSAVDSVIKAYGETMDLVGESPSSYNVLAVVPDAKQERQGVQSTTTHAGHQARPAPPPGDPYSVEYAGGRLRVAGELRTQNEARTLLAFLHAALSFLPEEKADPTGDDEDDVDELLR